MPEEKITPEDFLKSVMEQMKECLNNSPTFQKRNEVLTKKLKKKLEKQNKKQ